VADHLACFHPKPGDAVFNPAGMVHSLGGGVVVFEVQQNSDVTFRLYDWNHVDPTTGKPRPLQVEQALACIDFGRAAGGLVAPLVEETSPVIRERLFHCDYFWLWRLRGESAVHGRRSRPRPACWYASTAKGNSIMAARRMKSERGRVSVTGGSRSVYFSAARPSNVLEIEIPE
jgi:mannose-6-phosphate isomerase